MQAAPREKCRKAAVNLALILLPAAPHFRDRRIAVTGQVIFNGIGEPPLGCRFGDWS